MIDSKTQQKIADKIIDVLGNDVELHSVIYTAKILVEKHKFIEPGLIKKMILCSLAQLFEEGKIVIKERRE